MEAKIEACAECLMSSLQREADADRIVDFSKWIFSNKLIILIVIIKMQWLYDAPTSDKSKSNLQTQLAQPIQLLSSDLSGWS